MSEDDEEPGTIGSFSPLTVIAKMCPVLSTERKDCPACMSNEPLPESKRWCACGCGLLMMPAPPLRDMILWQLVVHLNDYHEWTRERIADWLETLDCDLTLIPLKVNNDEVDA